MRKRSMKKTIRIIHAARSLLLESGMKATSMEAIAARAGIAKATLYAYFPDRDTVIDAVQSDLAESMGDAFAAAFVGSKPLAIRLGHGLAGMYGTIADLIDGSDFAHELVGAHGRLTSGITAAELAVSEVIMGELEAAGIAEAKALTKVLSAACRGILGAYRSAEDVRDAIRLLCRKVVL